MPTDPFQLSRDQLEHAVRHAERTVTMYASLRERSRGFLAMGGVALTLASGLLTSSQLEGGVRPLVLGLAVVAVVAFVGQAVLSLLINRASDSFLMPSALEALLGTGEDPYRDAVELLQALSESNFSSLEAKGRLLTAQTGLFVVESVLLAGSLLFAAALGHAATARF